MTIFGLNSPEIFIIIVIALCILGIKRIEKGLQYFSIFLKFLLSDDSKLNKLENQEQVKNNLSDEEKENITNISNNEIKGNLTNLKQKSNQREESVNNIDNVRDNLNLPDQIDAISEVEEQSISSKNNEIIEEDSTPIDLIKSSKDEEKEKKIFSKKDTLSIEDKNKKEENESIKKSTKSNLKIANNSKIKTNIDVNGEKSTKSIEQENEKKKEANQIKSRTKRSNAKKKVNKVNSNKEGDLVKSESVQQKKGKNVKI